MTTNNNQSQSAYSNYPTEFQEVADDDERYVKSALAVTDGMRLQLPRALEDYQLFALATLRAVIKKRPSVVTLDEALHYVRDRLHDRVDALVADASARVMLAERAAETDWKAACDAAEKRAAVLARQRAFTDEENRRADATRTAANDPRVRQKQQQRANMYAEAAERERARTTAK